MSDIFREVDEEVRQDKALDFWRRYNIVIVILAVLIVAAAIAWRVYETRRIAEAEAASERFQTATALSRDGKGAEAEAALSALAKDGPKGIAGLAAMRAAAEMVGRDRAAAVKAYDALALDANLDPLMRDAARLRAAMTLMEEGDRKAVEARLTPLAAVGAPFRHTARELLAATALAADDLDGAGRWLDMIVVDRDSPQTVRQRADALLGLVRSGKKPAK